MKPLMKYSMVLFQHFDPECRVVQSRLCNFVFKKNRILVSNILENVFQDSFYLHKDGSNSKFPRLDVFERLINEIITNNAISIKWLPFFIMLT